MDDELDDLIEQWHQGDGLGVPLHEFLRMTWDEYKVFVSGSGSARREVMQRAKERREEDEHDLALAEARLAADNGNGTSLEDVAHEFGIDLEGKA